MCVMFCEFANEAIWFAGLLWDKPLFRICWHGSKKLLGHRINVRDANNLQPVHQQYSCDHTSQEVLGKNKFQQWLTFQYNNNPVGKKPRRPHYASPTVLWIPTKGSNKINKKQRTPSDPHLFTGCLGTNSQSLWTYEWSSDGGNQGAKSADLNRECIPWEAPPTSTY